PVVQRALVRHGQRADDEQVAADHDDVDGEQPDRDLVAEQRVQQLTGPAEALVDLAGADEDPAREQGGVDDRDDVFPDHGRALAGFAWCVRLKMSALTITTGWPRTAATLPRGEL